MGFFDGAKAQIAGQKAYRAHVAANELADAGKPGEAGQKYLEVEKLYEQAMAVGQPRPGVRIGYAILLMRLGRFEKAREVMQAMRLDKSLTESDWFDLRLNYSVCLWKLGQLDDAIATGKRAMQLKKCAAIYNTLGMYLVEKAGQTGDFAEAEAFNRESMDYDDEDAGILDNLGAMHLAMAKYADDPAPHRQKAKDCFAKAHAIKPRQITTLYALAKLYHEDGQDDKAREVLRDTDTLYYSAVCSVSREMMEALRAECR